MRKLIITVLFFYFLQPVFAEPDSRYQIRVLGKKDTLVTANEIKLDDIAEIKSESIDSDDIVLGLKKNTYRSSSKAWAGNYSKCNDCSGANS